MGGGRSAIPPTPTAWSSGEEQKKKPWLIQLQESILRIIMIADKVQISIFNDTDTRFLFSFHLCEWMAGLLTKENTIIVIDRVSDVILIISILEWIFLMKLSAFNDISLSFNFDIVSAEDNLHAFFFSFSVFSSLMS